MKALGKTDEEITLTRLALLKDLANKRAEHFKAAQRLYKKDSEEYKASQDAKKKADEDYRSALNDTANHLRSLASAYNDAALKRNWVRSNTQRNKPMRNSRISANYSSNWYMQVR